MARYTGPKTKKARALGEAIYGADRSFDKKKYPPGQHGNARRKQKSDYANQLKAKQIAKFTYGVLERQFRNMFERATRKKGITGEVLLQMLESRLDNVVFRMGIAPTRNAARQLVGHKHILVNGVVTNIPSCQLRAGDQISVRSKSKGMDIIVNSAAASQTPSSFSWLQWNPDTMVGMFVQVPERDQIPEKIEEQLIVELYSK